MMFLHTHLYGLWRFSNIHISQNNVATQLKC